MTRRRGRAGWRQRVIVVAVLAVVVTACGDGDDGDEAATTPTTDTTATTAGAEGAAPVIDPGDGGDYAPTIDPADFVEVIDNAYLPLTPGSRWVYESTSEDETEVITVEVTDERREVMGVSTVVVHDVVTIDDEVIEDTFDWYAQDIEGNVWYFGEDTTAYEDGEASTEGSWEAGVDGALPGIVMPADPQPAATGYRQEYLPGEAEDMGQVIGTDGAASVPAGEFSDLVVTRDWTPLEPEFVEEKYYASGVGLVQEIMTAGADEVAVLVEHSPG